MYMVVLFLCGLVYLSEAQNVNYTIQCTTHSPGNFTLSFENFDDTVPYHLLLDCSDESQTTVFLPPLARVDYSAVLYRAGDLPNNGACALKDADSSSDFTRLVIHGYRTASADLAIHVVYCDSRPNEDNRYSFANTTCQEDDNGMVQVTLENPYEVPITYSSFWCGREGEASGVISPFTTINLPAVFISDLNELPTDFCYFSPDAFDSPLMLYFSFDVGADEPIEQILNCYVDWQYLVPPLKTTPEEPQPSKAEPSTEPTPTTRLKPTVKPTPSRQPKPSVEPTPSRQPKPPVEPTMGEPEYLGNEPIVRLFPNCPDRMSDTARLELRADVPAYALARCQNGDHSFTSSDDVIYTLSARFERDIGVQDCIFYKKPGLNTFTLIVEIGWGEKSQHLLVRKRIKTVSCVFDQHGMATSLKHGNREGFVSPEEEQSLRGRNSTGTFTLQIVDVQDKEINLNEIPIGKKIRLRASDQSGSVSAFRALSCAATNRVNSYTFLRAGCGDGIVLGKHSGFTTVGTFVYSPYFDAFKLKGERTLSFKCLFTVCNPGPCDGSSCPTENRRRRSPEDESGGFYVAQSKRILLTPAT